MGPGLRLHGVAPASLPLWPQLHLEGEGGPLSISRPCLSEQPPGGLQSGPVGSFSLGIEVQRKDWGQRALVNVVAVQGARGQVDARAGCVSL